MSNEPTQHLSHADTITPGGSAWPAYRNAFLIGVVGLAVTLVVWLISWATGQGLMPSIRRLGFAYLIGYTFWLTIVVGCLFFVMVTHLCKAGWCVTVRRIPEHVGATFPTLAVLLVPIIIMTFANNGMLYSWTDAKYFTGKQLEGLPEYHHEGEDKQADVSGSDEAGSDHSTDAPMSMAHPASGESQSKGVSPTTGATLSTPGLPLSGTANNRSARLFTPEALAASLHAWIGRSWYITDDTLKESAGYQTKQTDTDTVVAQKPSTRDRVAGAPSEQTLREFIQWKAPWLNSWFFTLRWIIYLALWTWFGWWYRKASIEQDHTKDPVLSIKREKRAAPAMVVFGFSLTLAAFDLIMSLDPIWYSTLFGAYVFAGCVIGAVSAITLAVMVLQRRGWLPAVTTEHYHDLGKLLFAFIFFWGYMAFSQYVLVWYGSLPEEVYWLQLRGATTVPAAPQYFTGWMFLSFTLLFGHLICPWLFLLSRHVKRNRKCLAFACAWMLLMQLCDLYWLMRPPLSSDMIGVNWSDFVMLATVIIGVGGIIIGATIRLASRSSLIALGDPRLHESLSLDTTASAPLFHH